MSEVGPAEKMRGLPGPVALDGGRPGRGHRPRRVDEARSLPVVPPAGKGREQDRGPSPVPPLLRAPVSPGDRKAPLAMPDLGCIERAWTEGLAGVAPRHVLTRRAGIEAARQVGQPCRSLSSGAPRRGGLGLCRGGHRFSGPRSSKDRARIGMVRALGVDEQRDLAADVSYASVCATSRVDVDRRPLIDLFEGKSAVSCGEGPAGARSAGARARRSSPWT